MSDKLFGDFTRTGFKFFACLSVSTSLLNGKLEFIGILLTFT